jgi:hypothetical protein
MMDEQILAAINEYFGAGGAHARKTGVGAYSTGSIEDLISIIVPFFT